MANQAGGGSQHRDPGGSAANARPVTLVPYELESGRWVFLAAADAIPAGAVRRGLHDEGGRIVGDAPTTSDLRLIQTDAATHVRLFA